MKFILKKKNTNFISFILTKVIVENDNKKTIKKNNILVEIMKLLDSLSPRKIPMV